MYTKCEYAAYMINHTKPTRNRLISIVLFGIIIQLNCAWFDEKSLKDAPSNGIFVGSAFNPYQAFYERDAGYQATYQDKYAKHCSIITDESAMKMEAIWEIPDEYNFKYGDQTAQFAFDAGIKMRGHALIWELLVPPWLESGYTNAEVITKVQAYIKSVVQHFDVQYPGTFSYWDVVNEPILVGGANNLRNGFFETNMGTGRDYIRLALNWTHEVAPDAKLFINEYDIEQAGPKLDALYTLAVNLLSDGAPLHGIGFQTHVGIDDEFDANQLGAAMDRFIGLGLEVQITELDIRINDDLMGKTPDKLDKQAQLYADVSRVCLDRYPKCSAIVMWGLTDEGSYVNRADWLEQDTDWPHPFDELFLPKPAFTALYDTLAGY